MAIDRLVILQIDKEIDQAIADRRSDLDLTNIELTGGATLKQAIRLIKMRFRQLTRLSLKFDSQFTDAHFREFLTNSEEDATDDQYSLFERLTFLWLSNTLIGSESVTLLAEAVVEGRLTQLQTLWLDNTLADDASVKILAQAAAEGRLQKFRSLSLDDTMVSNKSMTILALAAAEGNLPQLEALSLNGTLVGDKTMMILAQAVAEGNLPHLRDLWLNSAKVSAPSEIVEDGHARRILQYYNDKRIAVSTGKVTRIPEAKLLVLGQGNVGKSVLCQRAFLATDELGQFLPPPPREETHSFDAHVVPLGNWHSFSGTVQRGESGVRSIPDAFRRQMRLRIWDFAGQDQLHGSHRFFVGARRAFYLLVLDASQSARRNRLGYWLRFIAQHGELDVPDQNGNKRAPVVVVLTQCDRRHEQVLQREPRDSDRDDDARDLLDALTKAKERNYFGANVLSVGDGVDWIEGMGIPRCMDTLPSALQQRIRHDHANAVKLLKRSIFDHSGRIVALQDPVPPAERVVRDWVLENFEIDAPDGRFAEEEPPLAKFRFDVNPAFLQTMKEKGVGVPGTSEFSNRMFNSLVMIKSLGLVHWIGDYLSSRHEEDKQMYRTVFNPRCIKTPVCRVLRGERVAYRCGRIDIEQCHQLLPDATTRQEIIDLMEGSQLLYHLVDSRRVNHGWLVPDLMQDENVVTPGEGLSDRLSHRWDVPFLPDRVLLQFLAHRILTHVRTYPQLTDEQWNELTRKVSRNFARLNWKDGGDDYIIEIATQINPPIDEEPWIRLSVSGGDEGRADVFHDVWKDLNDILLHEGMQPLDRVKFSGNSGALPTPTQGINGDGLGRKEVIRRQIYQFNNAVQSEFGTKNQHGKAWNRFWLKLEDRFARENVGDFLEATLTVDQISEALIGRAELPKKVKMKTPHGEQHKSEPKYQTVQTAMNKLSVKLSEFWRESLGGRADSMPVEFSNSRRNESQGVMGSYTIKLSIEKLLSVKLPKPDDRK